MSDSERIIKEGSYLLYGVSPEVRNAVARIMRSKSDFLDVSSEAAADETFGKSAVRRVLVGTRVANQSRLRDPLIPVGPITNR
jgi:hypothetical protein